MTNATLGFRTHSGWAVVVALAGPWDSPRVIDRRRIEIAESTSEARQPYHAAQKLELPAAAALIARYQESSRAMARQALEAMLERVPKNYEVGGCGILLGSGRPLGTLEATLASHALIHTAEGELFREAIVHACEACGLQVRGVRERELDSVAEAELKLSKSDLQRRLTELGQSVGRPWRQDEKHAALVAWLAKSDQSVRPTRQLFSHPTPPAQSTRGRPRL